MAHKGDTICGAIVTALGVASVTGTTKPTGLQVQRNRLIPNDKTEVDAGPIMGVYWDGEEPATYEISSQAERRARFKVEAITKQSGSSPDAALWPLIIWMVKAIMVDMTLGNLCAYIVQGEASPQYEDLADGLAAVSIDFIVTYHTAFNDPETV